MAELNENQTNSTNSDDLSAVLARESTSAPNQHVDPVSLQQNLNQRGMASKQDSAYLHQQVKPGQIIGYGIPTDQKVTAQQPKGTRGLSKKTLRLLLFTAISIGLLIIAAIVFVLARNVANPS